MEKRIFFSFDLFPYLCFATVCVCFEYKLSILVENENWFQELCHSGIFFLVFRINPHTVEQFGLEMMFSWQEYYYYEVDGNVNYPVNMR